MVLVEGFLFSAHQVVALPGFGNEHHHHVGQRASTQIEQLNNIIQIGRIGAGSVADGQNHLEFLLGEERRLEQHFFGAHPVHVAANGVDLAVVGDVAEGLRQLPLRKSVGRKAGVYQRQRRFQVRLLQVYIVRAKLEGGELSLIHNRIIGARGYVETVYRIGYLMMNGVRSVALEHEQAALQRHRITRTRFFKLNEGLLHAVFQR